MQRYVNKYVGCVRAKKVAKKLPGGPNPKGKLPLRALFKAPIFNEWFLQFVWKFSCRRTDFFSMFKYLQNVKIIKTPTSHHLLFAPNVLEKWFLKIVLVYGFLYFQGILKALTLYWKKESFTKNSSPIFLTLGKLFRHMYDAFRTIGTFLWKLHNRTMLKFVLTYWLSCQICASPFIQKTRPMLINFRSRIEELISSTRLLEPS